MTPIRNPFTGIPGYNCFGCAPGNMHGLQMRFHEEGDEVVSVWEPKHHFQGFANVLHGGIHSALMDELASWLVFVKLKTAGVTARMDIRYKKPVLTDQGVLTLRARLKETRRNLAVIETELYDSGGSLCSSGEIYYFTLKEGQAREQLHYPGIEAFYEPEESK